ncbi:hypothetical protein MAC_08794 [Metarhizium acridum CQMa 102]|uniref:Uncharacterized protein n=1 Tax=Metarhizium acridum (strain CQMa 102) TaxID=655827 RepID=E9EFZ6_METAQ|nr:uncharacterized protein MAC_08794 [Metarhizium acridum CQMa 102]EFY85176.1 hypothetical protein MAC_08794 [Metarhizium acridum CQMa 102]
MKYSMLSAVAVLAATSLGFPEFYWGDQRSGPGHVLITNNMNRAVRLDKVTGKSLEYLVKLFRDEETIIHSHQTVSIQASDQSADLKLRELGANHNQVELSYAGGDQNTYNYAIKPIEGDEFPGAVLVFPTAHDPPRCHAERWYPGQGDTPQVTCRDHVALRVYLQEVHHPPPFEAEYDDDGWY